MFAVDTAAASANVASRLIEPCAPCCCCCRCGLHALPELLLRWLLQALLIALHPQPHQRIHCSCSELEAPFPMRCSCSAATCMLLLCHCIRSCCAPVAQRRAVAAAAAPCRQARCRHLPQRGAAAACARALKAGSGQQVVAKHGDTANDASAAGSNFKNGWRCAVHGKGLNVVPWHSQCCRRQCDTCMQCKYPL